MTFDCIVFTVDYLLTLKGVKAVVNCVFLVQRYVQNTKLIYKKEFERFFESVNGELNKLANFERRATLRGSETMKSMTERASHVESKIDSKEIVKVSFIQSIL